MFGKGGIGIFFRDSGCHNLIHKLEVGEVQGFHTNIPPSNFWSKWNDPLIVNRKLNASISREDLYLAYLIFVKINNRKRTDETEVGQIREV